MARPKTLINGRGLPKGDGQSRYTNPSPAHIRRAMILSLRTGVKGLSFTRVRGVRKARAFPARPRDIIDIPEAEQFFEARYLAWEAVWGGTRPEFIVFDYLTRRRKMVFGVDFIFQSSKQGGRQQLGGSVVDFELPLLRLMFRVQGERFHLQTDVIASDLFQKAILSGRGFKVVDIWPHQLEQYTTFVMESALKGITLRSART